MRTFFVYHLPVVLYGIAILAVSSIPYLQTPGIRILAADKLAHLTEYALLAWLAFRSLRHITATMNDRRAFLLSLLGLAVFAVIDESLQRFTPGRHAEVADYLTDLLGGALVLTALWVRRRHQSARPR